MRTKEHAVMALASRLHDEWGELVSKARVAALNCGAQLELGDEPDFEAQAEKLIQAEIYTQASKALIARLLAEQRICPSGQRTRTQLARYVTTAIGRLWREL